MMKLEQKGTEKGFFLQIQIRMEPTMKKRAKIQKRPYLRYSMDSTPLMVGARDSFHLPFLLEAFVKTVLSWKRLMKEASC